MECRNIRPLIRRQSELNTAEQRALKDHTAGCGACRDEVTDAATALFAGVGLPLAMPPPGLADDILRRLPRVAPIDIERAAAGRRQVYTRLATAALVVPAVIGAAGAIYLQQPGLTVAQRLPGLVVPLALAAKALLVATAQPAVTLVVVLLALLAILLVPRLLSTVGDVPAPTRRASLGGAALAVCLLLLNVAVSRGDTGSVRRPITVTDYAGDVTSLAGDIVVRGDVRGDVVALGGSVVLESGANIHGSALGGNGIEPAGSSRIAQERVTGFGPLGAEAAGTGGSSSATSSAFVTRLAAVLAVGITVVLAGLAVVAWPGRHLVRAASNLRQFPLRAVALGLLSAAALVVVALSGTVALAATIGGLVLVPALLLLAHLPFVAGIAAVGEFLGDQLTGRPSIVGSLWGVGLQLLVVVLLGLLLPAAGMLSFYLLASAGLGGALLAAAATTRGAD